MNTKNEYMTPSRLDVALLLGEIHYMLVSAVQQSPDGWLTVQQLHVRTQIAPIELHHALAELIRLGVCTLVNGGVRASGAYSAVVCEFFSGHDKDGFKE